MFHFYISLAYIIPNIYVFFRLKHLFITRAYRLWYTIVYLLVFAIYPLAEKFAHQEKGAFLQFLDSISGYLLPFYLYVFLFLLCYELLLLINLLIQIVPVEKRKGFSFRFYSLTAIIVLSIVVVLYGVYNLNNIRVSKYQLEIPRKQSHASHLRIAFVADFHLQESTSLQYVEQYAEKVSALQPDLILYGGDIKEGRSEGDRTDAVAAALQDLHSRFDAYGVPGNHEAYGGSMQGDFFQKAGISLLSDTIVRIDSSYYLGGRIDQHFRNRKTLEAFLDKFPADLPLIVMDHRPVELQEVSHTPVDIQFSGHTHHGQMFPINLITGKIYELSWGYLKIRNTHFLVTSGLRLWGPPVKTAGKSEIMLVDVYFKP